MRIGINARVLLSSRMEGVCRYMHETLQRVVKNNPQDQFVFFFDRPYDEQFIYADNVEAVVIGPPTRHPFLWYWWFEKSLPKALIKNNIDVFYSGDTYMSLTTQVPTVLVCHDIAYAHFPKHIPWLKRKYYQKYFPAFHKAASQIISVSEATKNDIVKIFKLQRDKITVAHNALKEGVAKMSPSDQIKIREKYTEGAEYFVYVGSIHPRKNIVRLIRAFNLFKEKSDSNIKLILAGRLAWNTNEFKETLKQSPYQKDIHHLEGLSNAELNELTASAKALFYVSLFEGFGLPILEGMAVEIPVVCSNLSSMPEVAGDAAILVDPKNVEEITKAMQDLHLNPSLANELVQKGKKRVQTFSWEETAKITYDVISRVTK